MVIMTSLSLCVMDMLLSLIYYSVYWLFRQIFIAKLTIGKITCCEFLKILFYLSTELVEFLYLSMMLHSD